jgi:hypothetical protein
MFAKRALRIVTILALIAAGIVVACTPTPTPTPTPPPRVCIDFEAPLTLGTQYGDPVGQVPGDLAFTANGIPVTVWDFAFLSPGSGTFNLAEIDDQSAFFGSGQSIRSNNLNLEFDFSGIGFTTTQVTLEFLDLGGFENISIDGSPIIADDIQAFPATIGGVSLAVTTTPITGGFTGTLDLKGAVNTLRIGGQEFWIDNVCAVG